MKLLGVALTTACAGPSVLVAGDGLRNPEPPPPVLSVSVVAADDSSPLAAEISYDGAALPVSTDVGGLAEVPWPEAPLEVTVSSPGFVTASLQVDQLPEPPPLDVTLQPVVLTGTVLGLDDIPLPSAVVSLGDRSVTTGDDGTFTLARAVPGEVSVARPAWEPMSVAWDGSTTSLELQMEPRMINALRVGGPIAGNPTEWQYLLDLADNSAINAMVVDTKNEDGTVFHNSEVDMAHEINAVQAFYDLDKVIADMDAHGLYKITRIVTFQDTPMQRARPEIAAWDEVADAPWRNNKGNGWLDPTDRESWEYPLDLAEEACRRGFDEIQFDYVRFPSDGDISTLKFDEPYTEEVRVATITAFLEEAYRRISPMGCAVAADIFAITLESSTDEGIGQVPQELSQKIDVLSPMIYTYTYGSGWKGYDNPNEHALELVTSALDTGRDRLHGFAIYRPWIQTWLLEPSELRQVQQAVLDRGWGWMLWSATTYFLPEMLPPQ
jgi:hypothetical protein